PACQTTAANTARLFFAAGHSDSAIGGSLASGHQTLCLSDRGIGVHADGAATGSCQLRYPWHAVENLYCKDRRFVVDLVPPNEQSLLEDADKQLMAALADPTTAVRRVAESFDFFAGYPPAPPPCLGGPTAPPPLHRFTLDFAASAAAAAAASSGGPAAHLSGLSGGGDSGCCSCRSSGSSLLRRPSLDRISTSSADATPVRVSKRQQPQQQRGSPAGGSDSVDRCGCHSRSPSPATPAPSGAADSPACNDEASKTAGVAPFSHPAIDRLALAAAAAAAASVTAAIDTSQAGSGRLESTAVRLPA
uniref:FERM_C domain-containing protein n=1 Tax=Macrostomum lignano TaxID=282301 RepID=A0A1I8F405_9PLAT